MLYGILNENMMLKFMDIHLKPLFWRYDVCFLNIVYSYNINWFVCVSPGIDLQAISFMAVP